MCGIGGFVTVKPVDFRVVKQLDHSMKSRGPDDSGWVNLANGARLTSQTDGPPHSLRGLTFIHRRLSIIDTSEAGHQPMCTPDGRHWIVFNGEIYNYKELRAELESEGVTFSTQSDTEVLLQILVRHGTKALPRLTGMFAFAFHDRLNDMVLLARDPFGIKPLYYTELEDAFAFASRPDSLLNFPDVTRRAHRQSVYDYLVAGLSDHMETTFFADVKQLRRGHWMVVDTNGTVAQHPQEYWSPRVSSRSRSDATQAMRDRFVDNVRLHLRSDVPVGAALSGGVDSSAIVSAIRKVNPDQEIHSFSFIGSREDINEEKWIDLVAREKGCVTHKVAATSEDLEADIGNLVRVQGEPFRTTSIYAQYLVFKLAADNGIKVMLDGQGADELMAGYHYYYGARVAELIRRGRFAQARRMFDTALRQPRVNRASLRWTVGAFLAPNRLKHFVRRYVLRRDLSWAPPGVSREWAKEHGFHPRPPVGSKPGGFLKAALLDTTLETSLPSLLRYEDRNSMAHSLESRVPFLETEFADLIFSLGDEDIIDADGTTKKIFRDAVRGLVPDAILDRKDKVGYETSEAEWLLAHSKWVEGILSDPVVAGIPALDGDAIVKEWEAMVRGDTPYDSRVWRWVNLIKWTIEFQVEHD